MNEFMRRRKEYIIKYWKKLNLPKKVKHLALKILGMAEKEMDFSGYSPSNIAASIVYLSTVMSDIDMTMLEFQDVCECSNIRKNADLIAGSLKLDLPER